jgi:hypothetical protein
MAPSVSSETQLTRVERTWRFSCRARDRVIGPFIVCIEVMSSSVFLRVADNRDHAMCTTLGVPLRCGTRLSVLPHLPVTNFVRSPPIEPGHYSCPAWGLAEIKGRSWAPFSTFSRSFAHTETTCAKGEGNRRRAAGEISCSPMIYPWCVAVRVRPIFG